MQSAVEGAVNKLHNLKQLETVGYQWHEQKELSSITFLTVPLLMLTKFRHIIRPLL